MFIEKATRPYFKFFFQPIDCFQNPLFTAPLTPQKLHERRNLLRDTSLTTGGGTDESGKFYAKNLIIEIITKRCCAKKMYGISYAAILYFPLP